MSKEIKDITGLDTSLFDKKWQEKIMKGEDFKDSNYEAISTGSIQLDWALVQPILEGQQVEIFAENGIGKTTVALEIAANATKMGRMVFYVDLEYKLREVQINMIQGLDRSKLVVVHPDTGEEAMNMMHAFIVAYPGSLIILDSVGAILPEVESAEDYGKQSMALVARLCHQMVRKITGVASRNKCPIVFLNHPTSTMSMYGSPTTTHGGKAIKNRAAQRIHLKSLKADSILNEDKEKVGQWITATVIKNNANRPGIEVKFPLIYGKGIYKELEILAFAQNLGFITKSSGRGGGWYTIINEDGEEEPKKYREAQILELLETDKQFKDKLLGRIKEIIG